MIGLIVNNVQLKVTALQDPPAFVSVKMPFEMTANVVISRIADNGQVAKWSSCKNHKAYIFFAHAQKRE